MAGFRVLVEFLCLNSSFVGGSSDFVKHVILTKLDQVCLKGGIFWLKFCFLLRMAFPCLLSSMYLLAGGDEGTPFTKSTVIVRRIYDVYEGNCKF